MEDVYLCKSSGPEASPCEPPRCHNRRPAAAAFGQFKGQGRGPMSGLTLRGIQSPRLEMSSYLRREPWHSGPFEQHEDGRHGRRLAAVGGGLLSHDLDSNAWIQVELVKQELVRIYSDNVEWLQRWLWKIAHVELD